MITIPFKLPGFAVEQVSSTESDITIEARTTSSTAACPHCTVSSSRIHSYYQREPHDLPLSEYRVRLRLRVRRFRCLNQDCPHRTFAERVPDVVRVHAQRSTRLISRLRNFGLALGGEAGARRAQEGHIPASADTILRLIRRTPSSSPTPSVLGVDDWAWRKRQRYGTILVDLEQQRPVDLLPDRSADTLAEWLRTHPGVTIISRDRSTEYSRGASEGAPDAIQVADRWHLLQNLREALERMLARFHARLRGLPAPDDAAAPDPAGDPGRPYRRAPSEEARREANRERRRERFGEIKTLQAQGMNILQIAVHLKMSRVTVRRYFNSETFPERAPAPRGHSILDPYRAYLHERWEAGCHNGVQLWREIYAQGFVGSRKVVAQWVRARRTTPAPTTPKRYLNDQASPPSAPALSTSSTATSLPGPRRLVWLLMVSEPDLTTHEHGMLRFIRQEPDIERACDLAQQFRHLVRERSPQALSPWIVAATASGIDELRSFAEGLQREYASIEAALTLPWSQGQTEGQVNRLKTLKRQMYGRAGFDLLRQRVLNPV
ncbi:MAG: ISL3 family transposase [Ardenticatenaceae bacterium]|nr:ISL3 family transposase [Ardenticatenaceae bacterium]